MPDEDDAARTQTPVTVGFDGAGGGLVWASPGENGTWTDIGYITEDGLSFTAEPDTAARFAANGFITSVAGCDVVFPGWMAHLVEWGEAWGPLPSEETSPTADDAPAPARTATPGQASADSVIDAIDAAIEDTKALCGCGCGRMLPEDGPSPYFSGQDCQEKWMNAQTTDPDDVYDRVDAHGHNIEMGMGQSARPWRRARNEPNPLVAFLRGRDEELERRRLTLNWRRWCPGCQRRSDQTRITSGTDVAETRSWGSLETLRHAERGAARQDCGHCGFVWPGPPIVATVTHDYTEERGYVSLRMEAIVEAERLAVAMTMSTIQLEAARDAWGYVDRAWDEMERNLVRSPGYRRQVGRQERRMWMWQAEHQVSACVLHPDTIAQWLTGA